MSDPIGDRIEDFKVLTLLGKGSYGCVYRAKSIKTGLEVAIKTIDKKSMHQVKMVQRVTSEVEIHCRLKHPSILELYTCFEDDNYVYMVLEMCHNGAMHNYLKERKAPFTEEEARHFMHQIVKGMIYLHTHSILHRDLSLSNLLLTHNMNLKIADFGLATQLEHPNEKHFTMCGTPNYISPEVATRSAHGLESDIWSLGCMFYTFLKGHPPFDTNTAKHTLSKVVIGHYEMPANVSPQARDLIHRLLQKDPAHRLGLSEVLDHPFMTRRAPGGAKEPGRGASGSTDSGINTISTGCTSSSSGRSTRRTRRVVGPTLPDRAAAGPPRTRFEDRERCTERRRHPLDRFHDEGGAPYEEQPHGGFLRRAHSSDRYGSSGPLRGLSEQDRCHSDESQAGFGRPLFPSASAPHTFSEQGRISSPPVKQSANAAYYLSTQTHPPNPHYRDTGEIKDWHNYEGGSRRPVDRSAQGSGIGWHGDGASVSWKEAPAGRVADPHGSLRTHRAAGLDGFRGEEVPGAHLRPLGDQPPPRLPPIREKKALRDTVPPLCTARLKPFRQKTKSSVVSILDTGEVCMEYYKNHNGQERVKEVVRISPDGLMVTIDQPRGAKSFSVLDCSTAPTDNTLICSYGDLPEKYWNKYQYASKMVQLVKSKTPKVSLYTTYGKVILMENSPAADLEVRFYDGAKSHKTAELLRVVEKSGKSYTVKGEAGLSGLSAECRVYAQQSERGHALCLSLEAAMEQEERRCPNKVTFFPIIIGRPPTPLPSSPLSSHPPQVSPSMSSVFSSAVRSKSSPACRDGSQNASEKIILKDVGYASPEKDGEFSLHFLDGSQLRLIGGLTVYTSPAGRVSRYGENEKLPPDVHEKVVALKGVLDSFTRVPQAH
ncbi:serine/threonine-protein kinase PLK4 isoform X2 [Stigmatopora argus]